MASSIYSSVTMLTRHVQEEERPKYKEMLLIKKYQRGPFSFNNIHTLDFIIYGEVH